MGNPHTRAADGVSSALPLGQTFVFLGWLLCSRQKIRECGSFFQRQTDDPLRCGVWVNAKLAFPRDGMQHTDKQEQSLSKNTGPLPQTLL